MDKEKETSNKPNFIKEKYKSIKNYINSIKYYIELKKKINFHFIIILSVLIVIFYYLFKDAIFSIINNIKSNFNNKYSLQLNLELLYNIPTILFILLSFYFIIFCKNHITSKNINIIDKIIIITMIFSFVCTVAIDTQILLGLFISLITLIVRFILYKKANNTKNDNNIKTLWDIYTGNINDTDLKNLKIEDSDKIEHDLFERTQFVDNLHYSITSTSNYSDNFSIGVVGEWGSGKSTIINFAKQELKDEKDLIIIDDFDPWAIKSQDALILAIYNTIIENLGKNISYFKRKKVQNALVNISTNIPYIGKGIGSFFENRIDDYSEYKEIKADLEEKLENFDKRLIFIIDNLDRMNSENVLFLLTLIGTLFKLPNVTYIVAYDKKRLKKIFITDKIDPQYIEKIVTKEIVVPKIPNLLKEVIFTQCLKNCINFKSSYQLSVITEKKDDIEEIHEEILSKVATKFNNIREFIRFLNYIVYDINDTFLDRWDFLIIKTIEFLDYGLFNKLSKNKRFITRKIAKKDLEQYKSLKELNLTKNLNLIQKLSKKEKDFFEQIKESNFFDLLKLLSLNSTFFYNLDLTNTEELYPICEPNSDALIFSIFNISRFDDYFSHSVYSKELKEITKSFTIENNIEFSHIKEFFDTNNRYLKKKYLVSLNRFLVLRTNKKDKNKKLKMNLFYYFIDKILFYQKKDFNLYVIVVGILDSLFGLNRELLSEGEEEEITEQDMYYCSNTIKNFLQDIKSEDSIIAKRTFEFIKEAVEIEYNFMINEIYTKVLKMALDELEKENINNK